MSTISLIVALGGTSYAAFTLPNNSVGTKQLKNGAVSGPKIQSGAVTGPKIAKGAITGTNINFGALGTVPSANDANHASNADHAINATTATHAGSADTATNAGHATTAETAISAGDASTLGGIASSGYALAGQPVRAAVVNGAGNNAGCASGTLGIVVRDGRGNPIDGPFSFQVPGATPTYGYILSDGSVPVASPDVTTVDHTLGSGIYCIHFGPVHGGVELESSIAAVHEN
jgi:hypothetical protein